MTQIVEAPNVSIGWLRALQYMLDCHGECYNLMVSIADPVAVDPVVHSAYEGMVAEYQLLSIRQVAYTIFPRSLYIGAGRDADKLFERYNRAGGVYDRLRRRFGSRFGWGSYFQRMTRYPALNTKGQGQKASVNQLKMITEMIQQRSKVYKSAYTISILVPGDDGRRIMGGPCLNYLALQLDNSRTLNLLAVYRNHDFVQRAYGNYVGLGHLMEFLCDQTGYAIGELRCLSSHASVANLSGTALWPTKRQLQGFVGGCPTC